MSIGISRVFRDTTPLLPKALPKPSYGVTFIFLDDLLRVMAVGRERD
jgi:hypothetical protein